MKKIVSALLCALLFTSLAACSPKEKTPLDGMTGISLYTDFINNITSGELLKLNYSFDSWFDFYNSTSTRIIFKKNSAGKRELLYRERDLLVFWNYPTYDYYDGTTYYYKYKEDWYTDSFTKYDRVQQSDFIGIRDKFFTGNNVISDVVYQVGNGYEAQAVVQTPSKSVYYTLTAKIDQDFNFSNIRILAYEYDEDKGDYRKISTYFFRYSKINAVKKIARPEDLKLADIEINPQQ